MRIWITKYALTTGVFTVDNARTGATTTMVSYEKNGYTFYAHGKDWHTTREHAQNRVEEMRAAKLKSLDKAYKSLLTKTIEVPE